MNISVYITSYNQREYLKEAIESVLAQTLPAKQIVVVDDASKDGSQDLIADYARKYPELFTPIYHKQNTGVAQVRIDALNAVRGDYATFVDGDDWYLPEKLALEAAALKSNPDARLAFSNTEYMSPDGDKSLWVWADGEFVPQGDVFWQTVARNFPRCNLFRMELVHYDSWRKIGFHDPKLRLYEDFDMRIRLTKHLKVVYVDQVLSRNRKLESGLSSLSLEQHCKALDYLFKKNRHLIDTLPADKRRKAVSGFASWFAPLGMKAAKSAFRSGKVIKAFQLRRTALRFQLMVEQG